MTGAPANLLECGGGRKETVLAERRALNPDEPWLWTDEWRDGRIRSVSSAGAAALLVGFAAVWNAVVVGIGLAMYYREDMWHTPAVWVVEVLVGLAGLGLIIGAVHMVLVARKSPPTVLAMDTVPSVLGGAPWRRGRWSELRRGRSRRATDPASPSRRGAPVSPARDRSRRTGLR